MKDRFNELDNSRKVVRLAEYFCLLELELPEFCSDLVAQLMCSPDLLREPDRDRLYTDLVLVGSGDFDL